MQIYQEREEKTCDKPWREKNWKIYIISRWISLNSFEPRGSLFERRWAAFSANEKLINSRWRCWQSEEHAAPRINSPPFSLLASLLVETSSFKKEKEKKKEYCAQHARSRARYHPLDREEKQLRTPTRTIHLEIQCRFTRISSPSLRDIESKMEEMRRFQEGMFFSFFFFFTYLFLTPGNLNSFFAAICREILFSYTLFRNGGNFVIRSIILGMLLIS